MIVWFDLEPIPFSINDIFESVRDIVLPIAEEKGLAVNLESTDADFRIGHPVALSRVLLNLTTNALKFTNQAPSRCAVRALVVIALNSRCAIPAGHPAEAHGHSV